MLLRHRPDGALREGAIGEVPELIGWSGEGAMTHDLAFAHVAGTRHRDGSGRTRERAASAAYIDLARVRSVRIAHRSVDARRRGKTRHLRFIVHADLVVDATHRSNVLDDAVRVGRAVEALEVGSFHVAEWAPGRRQGRVVVVGAGPAGLYAALVLGTNGVAVDLIDRGADLRQRGRDVARFHRTRVPKPESNLLFGEGGAGTYSDGKLTLSSVVSPP